jgi:hypothetical protein
VPIFFTSFPQDIFPKYILYGLKVSVYKYILYGLKFSVYKYIFMVLKWHLQVNITFQYFLSW